MEEESYQWWLEGTTALEGKKRAFSGLPTLTWTRTCTATLQLLAINIHPIRYKAYVSLLNPYLLMYVNHKMTPFKILLQLFSVKKMDVYNMQKATSYHLDTAIKAPLPLLLGTTILHIC